MECTMIQEMLEKMKLNQASVTSSDDLIKSWIHDCAPKIYPSSKEHEKEIKAIFSHLEDFISNGSDSLKPSTSSSEGASICGARFGDKFMYHCMECEVKKSKSADRSALCETCFFASEHRHHKFQYMYTPYQSTACDCGDPQSWTNFTSCSIHDLNLDKPEPAPLPEDVVERAKAVFQAVLKYAFDFLSMESAPEVSEDDAQYSVVVLFDKYKISNSVYSVKLQDIPHKYELRHAFTDPMALQGVILTPASLESCNEVKAKNVELKPIIENSTVVSNQILALKLLDWLNDFISRFQQLRSVVANLALETSTFHKIILRDKCLWRASRQIWLNLIKSTILASDRLKSSLAEHLTVNYGSLASELYTVACNKQDVYYHYHSTLSLTRSFFTAESLAKRVWQMILQRDLLFVLVNEFVAINSKSGKMCVTKDSLWWSEYIMEDLKLILRFFKPKKDDWTDQLLRASFVKGVSQFLELLSGVQSDSKMDDKVANDLNNLLCPILNLIVEWCTSDDEIFNEIFQKVLQVFESCNKPESNGIKLTRKVADHEASCLKKKEKQQIWPLTKLLVNLLLLNSKSSFDLDMKKHLLEIVEPALTLQATAVLTNARMIIDYTAPTEFHNPGHRPVIPVVDVILLQIGAALLQDSDDFLIRALDKFDLVDWTRDDYEACFIDQSVNLEIIVGLVDEFLEMLIKMIEDRYVVGLTSEVSEDECFKRKYAARNTISIVNLVLKSTGEIYNEKYVKDQLRKVAESNASDSKKLPRLTKKFEFLVDILQCDVVIHIIKIILTRKLDLESASFSESHLIKILHLIKLALQEQESDYYSEFFSFTKRADKHHIFDLLEGIEKTLRRTDPNKKLLNSLMDKYKELAARSSKTISQES